MATVRTYQPKKRHRSKSTIRIRQKKKNYSLPEKNSGIL